MSTQTHQGAGGALSTSISGTQLEPYQMVSISARVISDETGADTYLPVILTPKGVVMTVLDYFLAHGNRSLSWMEQTARAIIRLHEYIAANGLPKDDWSRLFNQFAERRLGGTISEDSRVDPSGLGWTGITEESAYRERTQLKLFFKWAAQKLVASGRAPPSLLASLPDHTLSQAALAYRRDSVLLGHLWNSRPSTYGNQGGRAGLGDEVVESASPVTPVKSFPEDEFWNLVFNGFEAGNPLELQAMLHVILINCGGLRSSEPPHLWVQDVHPDSADPTSAVVRIYHPSKGAAPHGHSAKGSQMITRAAHLRHKYGLAPRNTQRRAQRSGYKGGFHDDSKQHFKTVRWFPTYAGEIFLQLWNAYIPLRAALPDRSPFAFVSFEGPLTGFGFNRKALHKRYVRACKRVGLEVSRYIGTNLHGHRHAYGKRLGAAGVPREETRRAMHHRHQNSQDTYKQLTDQEVSEELHGYTQRLQLSNARFQEKYGAKLAEVLAKADSRVGE